MNSAKLSASLPAKQFAEVERARRRAHLKRSQVVQEALAMWLHSRRHREQARAYVQGYVNEPEDAREADAYVKAWAEGLEAEDWT